MTFGECTWLTTSALPRVFRPPVAAIADCGSTETGVYQWRCGFCWWASTVGMAPDGIHRLGHRSCGHALHFNLESALSRRWSDWVSTGFGGAAVERRRIISPTVASRKRSDVEPGRRTAQMSFALTCDRVSWTISGRSYRRDDEDKGREARPIGHDTARAGRRSMSGTVTGRQASPGGAVSARWRSKNPPFSS